MFDEDQEEERDPNGWNNNSNTRQSDVGNYDEFNPLPGDGFDGSSGFFDENIASDEYLENTQNTGYSNNNNNNYYSYNSSTRENGAYPAGDGETYGFGPPIVDPQRRIDTGAKRLGQPDNSFDGGRQTDNTFSSWNRFMILIPNSY